MPKPYPALTRALRAIAEAAGSKDIWSGVSVDDALAAIDDDVLIEWAQREGGYVSVLSRLVDEVHAQLQREKTDDRERALIQCLAQNLPPHGATLHAAFVHACAGDLADEAYSAAEQVAAHAAIERKRDRADDRGDWLHERRKQDRLDRMYAAGAL